VRDDAYLMQFGFILVRDTLSGQADCVRKGLGNFAKWKKCKEDEVSETTMNAMNARSNDLAATEYIQETYVPTSRVTRPCPEAKGGVFNERGGCSKQS